MTIESTIKELVEKHQAALPVLDKLDRYWAGDQPAAFMSKKSAEALEGRLGRLAVNLPRLAVESLVERLTVTGFQVAGSDRPSEALWGVWRRQGLEDVAAQVHADALVYGRAFVTVWADSAGRPTVSAESPRQVTVLRDPVTREVTAGLKVWVDAKKVPHGVLYGPEAIYPLTGRGYVTDLGLIPSTGWVVGDPIPNPLGVVPVVPFVNRGRTIDAEGVSEMHDVLDLADALNKLMQDVMVTAESYARPRRWATGLEVLEDEEGNVVDPFSREDGTVWQAESPDTKFGQFEQASLTGYADMIATLTQQIGALTGLPPHYLGLNGDQPPSAESIRSAEASLVARSTALQRSFGRSWALVAALVYGVQNGTDPLAAEVTVSWADPATRTVAQSHDAALKLRDMGVPLATVLRTTLGWSQEQIDQLTKDQASGLQSVQTPPASATTTEVEAA